MTKIKICGLKSLKDIAYVNEHKPDYIGFVFAESKRKVNDKLAKEMKACLDVAIKAVGVFVNEPIEHIVSLCNENIIDIIQLHGDEDNDYMELLKSKISKPIIKVLRVQSKEQIIETKNLSCNHILLDTYVKDQYGGSGLTFDLKLIPENIKPFFLAGGIQENNVLNIISECHPYCVDVSSGVETDGIKDKLKIKNIIELVRNQEAL